MTTSTETPTIVLSGFPWEEADLRYCAFTATHFGYGSLPEHALAALRSVQPDAAQD